jgi:hypothetical protein
MEKKNIKKNEADLNRADLKRGVKETEKKSGA